MAVNYVTVKTSFKKRDNTDSKFVKVINNDCIDKHKMARTISDQCSLTEADVVAVLQAYESNLKLAFAKGNSVEIFSLGTLKPTFKADFDNNGNVIKNSLRLSKLRLITGNEFIREAKGYIYKYCGDIDYYGSDFETRSENIIDYLSHESEFITCAKYATLNNCSISTANYDLKILKDKEILKALKIGQTYTYSLNKDYTDDE